MSISLSGSCFELDSFDHLVNRAHGTASQRKLERQGSSERAIYQFDRFYRSKEFKTSTVTPNRLGWTRLIESAGFGEDRRPIRDRCQQESESDRCTVAEPKAIRQNLPVVPHRMGYLGTVVRNTGDQRSRTISNAPCVWICDEKQRSERGTETS
jgi:hypothetical protein